MFMNFERTVQDWLTVGLGRQMKGLVCAREGQENK